MNIVATALEYFDRNTYKYKKFLSNIKFYKIKHNNTDIDRSVIIFYNKHEKILAECKYEEIGNYYPKNNVWVWSWGIPSLPKNKSFLSRKILTYGLDININTSNNDNKNKNNKKNDINNYNIIDTTNIFLKAELITPRLRLNNIIQLEIHLAITSYLTKLPFIFYIDFASTSYNSDKLLKFNYKHNHVSKKVFLRKCILVLDYKIIDDFIDTQKL